MRIFSLSLAEMFLSFWRNRHLIKTLIKREIIGRYRGSLPEILRSFLNPLFKLSFSACYRVVYLNKDRKKENGGHLTLWGHQDVSQYIKNILTFFNRTVIFPINTISCHGYSEPVVCEKDDSRKSIVLYSYSNGRPEEEIVSIAGTFDYLEKMTGKRILK